MNLEKNCFKDFGRNLFQRFWSKIISNFLEAKIFKDFGRKAFQRFWRKIASKNLRIYIYIYFSLINHATSTKLYWSYYLHRSRDFFSPVCWIFFMILVEVCITFWNLNLVAIWGFSLVIINLLVIIYLLVNI